MEEGNRRVRPGHVTMEAEVKEKERDFKMLVFGFEDGGRSRESMKEGGL